MLNTFRTASKTWVVKLLFALLALSFVAWGVGDVVRGGLFGHGPAIQVGDTQLNAAEVLTEFKREVDRLQPMFGGKLTNEDARRMGLLDRTIENIVTRTLVDEAAHELGLAASEEAVLKRIAADPDFRDERGQFSRDLLRRALARNGLSEASFLRIERNNMIRGQMAEGISGGVAAPKTLVDPLVRWREERRVAEYMVVRDDSVPLPAAPDQATVEKQYKDNAARFMAPEYRALTVLLARPADVAAQVEVTAAMVEETYQSRADEFHTPARRQISQIVLPTQAAADKAAALVTSGKDLSIIAKELSVAVVDLGAVGRDDLPEPLAAAVFAANTGALTAPVQSPLGWHVAKVGQSMPERTRSLAEVRPMLEQELRREKALDRLGELVNQVEDTLGGGASVEETAGRFGLKIVKVPAMDAKGRTPNGKPVADVPRTETFLDVAFHTDSGTESQLSQVEGDGYFLVRVDAVTPPQPKPLAEVRGEVVALWQAERRHAQARERAEKAAQQIKAGDPLAKAAAATGAKVTATQPFTRDDAESAHLPGDVVAQLFKAKLGETAVGSDSSGWVVARLTKVVPFDPATQEQVVAAAQRRISNAVTGDLVDQYIAALNASFGVKVDRSQLAREE